MGKKKMGRPRKPDALRRIIAMKVSAAELRDWKKAAKAKGLSLSAFILAPHRKGC
jgi:hypothetical protein